MSSAVKRAQLFGLALLVAGLALGAARPSSAKPQWNTGLESGVSGTGDSFGFRNPSWANAVHADVMFLRERATDCGVGPSLRLGSIGFEDLRADAGVSLLLPIFESFPVVLETGGHLRNFAQPGIFGSVFFGLRSFNHYGHYEMAAGLSLTAERSFANGTPSALWLTARIDGSWVSLPFVALFNAAR